MKVPIFQFGLTCTNKNIFCESFANIFIKLWKPYILMLRMFEFFFLANQKLREHSIICYWPYAWENL